MATNQKIIDLQRKLYLTSKHKENYKFYSLYDKIYRIDILIESYQICKKNKGSAGIDGITFEKIEILGVSEFIQEIHEELKNHTYKPSAIKRVEIPKENGETRPLGIPTIKDRVVQTALKIVIEPIFEAHLHNNSYGYRPKRTPQEAIAKIEETIKNGYNQVYDADLSKYFDTIPHEPLMEKIKHRISDKNILVLIKRFLKVPIEITNKNNRQQMLPKNKKGTPQGGVISPLLANIYLNDFITFINEKTPCIAISFADDFVILTQDKLTKNQKEWIKTMLEKEFLILNEDKTKIVDMNIVLNSFDFLGYTFKRVYGFYKKEKTYIKIEPSKKSMEKLKLKIKKIVTNNTYLTLTMLIKKVNPIIRGWKNYFEKVGYPNKAFFKMDWFIVKRFYQWAKRLSQRGSKYFMQNTWKILKKEKLVFMKPF